MDKSRLSESQEDYIKQIFKLEEINDTVTIQNLAENLCVRPASVTGMVKKLVKMNLAEHKPYQGVRLTDIGEKIALEVIRHHRLLELYLADHLNYSWEEIHEEAEILEHFISEKFEAAISEIMGNPTLDPHGDPIPSVELKIPATPHLQPAGTLKSGQQAVIRRVMSQDKDILNMLSRLELTIDSNIELTGRDKMGVRLKTNDNQYLIPNSIAHLLWVQLPDSHI